MTVKVVAVSVSDYTVASEPDYHATGVKVDRAIETNFPDGIYIVRGISVDDHPGRTLDDLVRVIQETGTDKYDPERKPVAHADFAAYDYDIQAGAVEIKDSRLIPDGSRRSDGSRRHLTVFGEIAYLFFKHAPLDRGHPVRIDLLLVYDPRKLVKAKLRPGAKGVREGLAQHLYRFVDREHKRGALLGLVEILR